MSFLNSFFISLLCYKVGTDQFGNRYYESNKMNYLNQKKRYVIYNGIIEPSKVPPLWHAWLHYLSHEIPTKDLNKNKLFWQQGHLPNVSGTKRAHNSHISNITSAHSTIWTPKQ